jgi:hypothetical protein
MKVSEAIHTMVGERMACHTVMALVEGGVSSLSFCSSLQAIPWTRYSMKCQEMREQGG